MRSRDTQLAAVVTRLAVAIATAVTLIPPLGYFTLSYVNLAASLDTRAEIIAGMVGQIIARTPQAWMYQQYRLEEMLTRRPIPVAHEAAYVEDAQHNLVAQAGARPNRPVLVRAHPLHDSGTVVGYLRIEHSLRNEILGTIFAAILGALLGGAVFVTLRVLPLRALRRVTDALFLEKERAETTLHSIGDAVITVDAADRIEYLNPVAEQLTGWSLADVKGRALDDILRLIDEDTLEPLENPLRRALAENRVVSFGAHGALVRRDKRTVAIEDSAAPIRDRSGRVIGGVLVFHDVTAARTMAQRLTWAATHDTLTGLVNRREYENRLEAAFASARSSGGHHVLCYMDLDQFKIVNDTAGHAAGDELLRQLAALLQSKIRESDTLARLGGDEFGLLLDGCPLDRGQLIAADMLATVRDFRFNWQGKIFTVGVSMGLVAITRDSISRADIQSAADAACYVAKEQGRNRIYVYRADDHDLSSRRREMDWATRIKRAMDEDRLTLYCQRYLALTAAAGSGGHLQILLRMIDEDGNLIEPGSFLPAAERYNLMTAIDRWVVQTTYAQYRTVAARLADQFLTCAINISGASLHDDTFTAFIRDQARSHSLPPGAICFEITETAALNNLRKAGQFMQDAKTMGFCLALDNFGSGTSFFGYLRNLPVDYLKIDGGFVKDMVVDPLDQAMTETINRIGHIVGVKTVAKSVESDAIIDKLKAIGVDFAQGSAIDLPRPLSEAGKTNIPASRGTSNDVGFAVESSGHRPASN